MGKYRNCPTSWDVSSTDDTYDYLSPLDTFDSSVILDTTFKLKYTQTSPVRTLDATGIKDNFFANSIEWLSDEVLGVCINDRLYGYKFGRRQVVVLQSLRENDRDYINENTFSSICSFGNYYAYGLSDGRFRVKDMMKNTKKGKFNAIFESPVSAMAMKNNILCAGHKNGCIIFLDLREGTLRKSYKHKGNITNIKFDPFGHYFAAASEDKKVTVWAGLSGIPTFELQESKSPVKGLAWCEQRRNYLLTGSSNEDSKVRMYNLNTPKKCMVHKEIKTHAGVSSIVFNKKSEVFFTSHGNYDDNLSTVEMDEKNPNVLKAFSWELAEEGVVGGHTGKILNAVFNKKKNLLVSISTDENIKFWEV